MSASSFNYDFQHLDIRYATALAASQGLRVSVEIAQSENGEQLCVVWQGTQQQFRALWFVPPLVSFDSMRKRRYFHPSWLRGDLFRLGSDEFRYVVHWSYSLSAQQRTKIARIAAEDPSYQRFLAATLTKVELHDEES